MEKDHKLCDESFVMTAFNLDPVAFGEMVGGEIEKEWNSMRNSGYAYYDEMRKAVGSKAQHPPPELEDRVLGGILRDSANVDDMRKRIRNILDKHGLQGLEFNDRDEKDRFVQMLDSGFIDKMLYRGAWELVLWNVVYPSSLDSEKLREFTDSLPACLPDPCGKDKPFLLATIMSSQNNAIKHQAANALAKCPPPEE